MGTALAHGLAGVMIGLLLTSCTRDARSLQRPLAASTQGAPPAVAGLIAGILGGGARLSLCDGRQGAANCVLGAADGGADGMLQLQLSSRSLPSGIGSRASALRLDGALESIHLQLQGETVVASLPARLSQLCGVPGHDSQLQLGHQAYLRSVAWDCPQAQVQLTALHSGQNTQGALSLTTARGQAWVEQHEQPGVAAVASR